MYEDIVDPIYYRSIVEKLIKFNHLCPNVFYSFKIMDRFMMRLQILHLTTIKYILRYIVRTLDYDIFYSKNLTITFSQYVDIDWAWDLSNDRSTIGFIFMLEGSLITWLLKRKPIIALSSLEA